jgi:nucleotide-binding universal stress UspA family protein
MKILYTTDGSDSARNAADMLMRFPFPEERSAIVMTVIDNMQFALDKHVELDEDQIRLLQETEQVLTGESERLLAAEAARLQDAGWVCSTELRRGDTAEEIIRAAEELQPDMIVLGSHGLRGMKHFLLGSVSNRVLKHACCSVLIVRPSPGLSAPPEVTGQARPWRILVAYDGSEPARDAIRLCAALPLDDNAEISVVSVMPMIHMYRQDIRQQLNPIWQQQKHARKQELEQTVGSLQWTTPHVTPELLEGADVAEVILDIAASRAIDLVVIGSKGRSTFKRFLLGSSTSDVAGHAPCSVLVVRGKSTPG